MTGWLLGALVAAATAPAAPVPAACRIVATTDARLGRAALPAGLGERLSRYRALWRQWCARTTGHPTLEQLLQEALDISTLTFGDGFPIEAARTLSGFDPRPLPGLGPASDDPLWVYDEEFVEAATVSGNDVDREFWQAYPKLRTLQGHAAWRKTFGEDAPGCTRYGEFDWIDALEGIQRVRRRSSSGTYAELARMAEQEVWVELGSAWERCTCGPPAAVVRDMEAVLHHAARVTAMSALVPQLREQLQEMRQGGVKLLSHRQGQCDRSQ